MAGTKNYVYGSVTLVAQTILTASSDAGNSLEGIDISGIPDRSVCFVNDATGSQEFRWFEDSVAVPDGIVIVLPSQLTLADPGRWILVVSGGGGGAVNMVSGVNGIVAAPATGNVVVDGAALYARDGSNGALTADLDLGGNDIVNGGAATFSGAVAGATFNGVALTTAGSATNFLNEQGNYVSLAGATNALAIPDKGLVPIATAGDQAPTGVTISSTPSPQGGNTGYVSVFVNNVQYRVGGATSGTPCYFSADGGVTARAVNAIQSGDQLIWNQTVGAGGPGFNLDTDDTVDLIYVGA